MNGVATGIGVLVSSGKAIEYADAATKIANGVTPDLLDKAVDYANSVENLSGSDNREFSVHDNPKGPRWGDQYSKRGPLPAWYHQTAFNKAQSLSAPLYKEGFGPENEVSGGGTAVTTESRETYVVHAPRTGVINGEKVTTMQMDVKLHGVVNATLGYSGKATDSATGAGGTGHITNAVEAGIENGYSINLIKNEQTGKWELPKTENAAGQEIIDASNIDYFTKVYGLGG
ncbi:hypothetical protein CS022_13030 [Veronia nyctiphanis]|uniref:Uncharacterized protein n=1 Tax=Veronia nyctiphanis TaxID=1278244 RepID=A0A4Q0YRP5_9GAMM|nr:hypothetical protein CS022_13030 [Veronia nyctiphanis]